jgi:alpha-galactosidase
MKTELAGIRAVLVFPLLAVLLGGSDGLASQTEQRPPTEKLPSIVAKIIETIPFCFVYGGKPSSELLPQWEQKRQTQTLPGDRERRVLTYRDRRSGLEITNEITVYNSLQAVDWVVRLRNTGSADTPILENLRALDLGFDLPGSGDILLHQASGSVVSHLAEDFMPLEARVATGGAFSLVHYEMKGDEHVGGQLPYFDLQWQNGGVIGAVGWSGQWEVHISRDSARGLTLQAGQQGVHLKLHPGESVRTPSILLVQWGGEQRVLGHNLLRRLLVAYYVPRIEGKVALPPVAATTAYVHIFDGIVKKTGKNPLDVLPTLRQEDLSPDHGFPSPDDALNAVNEQNQLDYIRNMPSVGIEAYWMDAGWFVGGWPYGVGNWDPDPEKFPHGLKPLGDAAHQKGLKFLLWFEPERVSPGTAIERQHPEWILHFRNEGKWGGRFNFGNSAARQWITDLLSGYIHEWGIDIFRNDNNICPLPFWLAADAPDRRGITENHDIEGLYAVWDGLLNRHPHLEIDNANWRITGPDIEAMKRTIGSLTRSEITSGGLPHPVSDQAQTAELNLWIPLDANLLHGLTPYSFRSTATTGVGIGLDLRSGYIPRDQLTKAIAQLKELRLYWLGDYYPLSSINFDENAWCAWQFDRPDLKAGYAIFFRRSKSSVFPFDAALRGLDPNADYEVTLSETYDMKEKRVMKGAELGKLRVEIGSAPGVMLVRYRRVKASPSPP